MINKALVDRKKKLEESQNLIVEMRPEFANALKKSINFSCKNQIAQQLTFQNPEASQHSFSSHLPKLKEKDLKSKKSKMKNKSFRRTNMNF